MLTNVETNTIKAVERLSIESKDPQIAEFFELVKRTNEALMQQSEYLKKLDAKKVTDIIDMSKSNPDLAPIVPLLEAYQETAVTAIAWPEPQVKSSGYHVPVDFLTTGDVAFLLGVSPQQVRTYCQEGRIKAWRTNEKRGEWRIELGQYIDHPRFPELVGQMEEARKRNSRILSNLESLSEDEEYIKMMDRIEEERERRSGGLDT